MSTTATKKTAAKEIRAALKAEGINSRQVSVRTGNGGPTNQACTVAIKDASVDPQTVMQVAARFRKINRDANGTLTHQRCVYVDVEYDFETKQALAAAILAEHEDEFVQAAEATTADEGAEIEGYTVYTDNARGVLVAESNSSDRVYEAPKSNPKSLCAMLVNGYLDESGLPTC